MAEDDPISNLFATLANKADEKKSLIDLVVSHKRRGIKFDQTSVADFLNSVGVLQQVMSSNIRGTLKLAYESKKAEVIELQKKVADLEASVSDSNLKINTMGEELQASEKKLAVSNNVNKDLKNKITELNLKNKQYMTEILQLESTHKEKEDNWKTNTEKLRTELEEKGNSFYDLNKKLDALMLEKNEVDAQLITLQAEKCTRDDLIQELETRLYALQAEHEGVIIELNLKNKHYMSEISQLENTHKEKEDNWKTDIGKLRTELDEKGKSFYDLNKKLDDLMSEKNEIDAQLVTLQAEKCTRDNLIQELETRLNAQQAEHEGVIASFNNAREVKTELTTKVEELEKEVDRQNEVILCRTDEKMEAIRQLSSALDHYKSRYEQLRKVSVNKNMTRCFNFLH